HGLLGGRLLASLPGRHTCAASGRHRDSGRGRECASVSIRISDSTRNRCAERRREASPRSSGDTSEETDTIRTESEYKRARVTTWHHTGPGFARRTERHVVVE